MNTSVKFSQVIRALIIPIAFLSAQAPADDGSWTLNANGTWTTTGNWSGGTVAGGAAGDIGYFTNNISGNRTITLDTPVILGHLWLGDYAGANYFNLVINSSGSLTLDNGAESATINKWKGGSDIINAPITLLSHLIVTNDAGYGTNLTIRGTISGDNVGLTKEGRGLLILQATNTYTGPTIINNGTVRLMDSRWIDTSSNLTINGGVLEIVSNNFTSAGGLGIGSNQVQIPGGVSGYSVNGNADRTVTIGSGGSEVEWGSTYFNPTIFILNTTGANRRIIFNNAIDLNGADREIDVVSNVGRANRSITNGAATAAGLIKGGAGTLEMYAANSYDGTTEIRNGAIRISNIDGLSTNNTVILNGGVLEFQINHPYLTPVLGTGAGTVQFAGGGGFGAQDGIRTVNVNGTGETLKMGDGDLANWGALLLNGANSGGRVVIANGLDLNGASRTVSVNSAWGVIEGIITNTASGSPARLEKVGSGGLLILGDNYRHDGGTSVRNGTMQLGDYFSRDGVLPGIQGNAGDVSNTATIVIANQGDLTLTGNIVGTGSLHKYGWTGTLTLAGTNTYSGTTVIRRGVVALDFAAPTAPATNIIGVGSMSRLYVGEIGYTGGTLLLQGADGTENAQTFRDLTVNSGTSTLGVQSGTGGSVDLMISNVVRNIGGVIDFTLPASGAIRSTAALNSGILGGYATIDGTHWATLVGQNLAAYADYYFPFGGSPVLSDDATMNLRLAACRT